jgi:hypothetical protein
MAGQQWTRDSMHGDSINDSINDPVRDPINDYLLYPTASIQRPSPPPRPFSWILKRPIFSHFYFFYCFFIF